jgi:hypothetical protein
MNKKIILIAAVIGFFAGCISCSITPLVKLKGNGDLVTSEKTFSAFDKINVSGRAEVRFHTAQEYRAVVTVDENLDEYVEIVIKNNVLIIGIKSGYSYSFTKFLVDVYCPNLTGVLVSGSGSFENVDELTASTFETSVTGSGKIKVAIECESFSAKVTGSGAITITGNSKDANISITGSGKFNGNEFKINDATVRTTGSGNMDIYVTDNLKVNITGSGGINYRGEPIIESHVTGSGRIRKR